MNKQQELEQARRMREAAAGQHASAWARYMKSLAANRAALAKGGRMPYRIAQAMVDASAAVGRMQDRLDDLDSRINRLVRYGAVAIHDRIED